MLVLSRKAGQKLIIGDCIRVTISKISGNRVSVAIDAPNEVVIRRGVLCERAPTDSNAEKRRDSDAGSLHYPALPR